MKTVAVVAWREIIEHRVFLAAAGAALLLTLVVPIASGLMNESPSDLRTAMSVWMAIGFTCLSAILLGASAVSGTVAAGHFGFFLSRPVSGAAIWLGKVTGILVVLFACEAIILAPAALTGPDGIVFGHVDALIDPWGFLDLLREVGLLIALGVPLPLAHLLMGHAAGTLWRGRTPWLVLDLMTLLAVSTITWLSLYPLLQNRAEDATTVVASALGAVLLVALVGAPLAQVAAGGVDPRRHHRVFSLAFGVPALILCGCVGAYAAWLNAPGAADLIRGDPSIKPSLDGRWVAMTGYAVGRWDYEAAFLVDLGSSTTLRIDAGPRYLGPNVAFSADGGRAAWLAGSGDLYGIRYCDLDEVPARSRDTAIFVSPDASIGLSQDGDRLAVLEDDILSVRAFPGGDLLGSTAVRGYRWRSVRFGPDGTLFVIFEVWSESLARYVAFVSELDRTVQELRRTEFPGVSEIRSVAFDKTRDRLLTEWSSDEGTRWSYVDAKTLQDVAWTLARPLGSEVALLADGRLVQLAGEPEGRRIEVVTPEGVLDASFPLPLERWLRGDPDAAMAFGPQPASDRVVIWMRGPSAAYAVDGTRTEREVILDMVDGTYLELDEDVTWLLWRSWRVAPGSPASRLVWGRDGLMLWDPGTGETEELAARYE
jgi:hypothetical protein